MSFLKTQKWKRKGLHDFPNAYKIIIKLKLQKKIVISTIEFSRFWGKSQYLVKTCI